MKSDKIKQLVSSGLLQFGLGDIGLKKMEINRKRVTQGHTGGHRVLKLSFYQA